MDESRKQFEAEVLRRAEVSGYAYMDAVLNKTGDGGYATTWVDMMWEGWQASLNRMAVTQAIDIIGGVEASMYLYQAAAATTLFDKQRFICKAIEKLSVRKN